MNLTEGTYPDLLSMRQAMMVGLLRGMEKIPT
jgi:hypothetical protein